MAKQLNVNLAMTADTSKAKAELQALQRQLNELMISAQRKDASLGFSTEIQKATQLAAQLKVQLESATSSTGKLDLTKFNEGLQKSGLKLQDYRTALSSLGPEGSQAFAKLASSIMQAEVPLRRSNTLLSNFAVTLKNTARWQISSSILHGFMGALQGAYGYAQDLNESLNNIRIVTGQSIDQMAKFADEANRAAKALSASTTAYTDAALIYYQQGLDDKAVKERTDVTIKLSNVSRQSAEEVSSQMTAIWNNFDDGSKNLEYYADVITKLGAATAASSSEIADGLQKFAAVADTVGLSYEKATAALATVVAETRQSADVVGTAFKTMFARFQGVTLGETLEDGVGLNKYSKALETVGVNILEANGDLKDMDTILDELGKKWNSISNAQQVALAETVAGTRQYAQFMAIMENYDKILANQNLATGAEGTLQKQADIYAESWEAAGKRVRAASQAIYQDLLDDKFFIKLLNWLEKTLSFLDKFIDNVGGLKGVLITLGSVLTTTFSPQIQASLNNMVASLAAMSVKGQKAAQAQRQDATRELLAMANGMSNSKTSQSQGAGMQAAYENQAKLQQSLLDNAKYLTEEEKKRAQLILDMNTKMGEEAIKAGQIADSRERELKALGSQQLRDAERQGRRSGQIIDPNDVARTKEIQTNISGSIKSAETLRSVGAQVGNTFTNLNKSLTVGDAETAKMVANFKEMAVSGLERLEKIDFGKFGPDAQTEAQMQKLRDIIQSCGENFDELSQKDLDELATQIQFVSEEFETAAELIEDNVIDNSLDNLADSYHTVGMEEEQAAKAAREFIDGSKNAASASVDASDAVIQLKNSAESGSKAIRDMGRQSVDFGMIMSTVGSTIMNVASALNAFKSIGRIWNDDDLSTGEKVLQTMMSFGAILPLISNMTRVQTMLNGLLSTSIVAVEIPLAAVYGIVIAIVAVGYGLIKLFEHIKEKSPEGQLKKLKEEQEGLAKATEEARAEWEKLQKALSSYDEGLEGLKKLTQGTDEFNEKLKEVNDTAEEIIKSLSLVFGEDYYFDSDTGAKVFTERGNKKIREANNTIARGEQSLNWVALQQQNKEQKLQYESTTGKTADEREAYAREQGYKALKDNYEVLKGNQNLYNNLYRDIVSNYTRSGESLTDADIANLKNNYRESISDEVDFSALVTDIEKIATNALSVATTPYKFNYNEEQAWIASQLGGTNPYSSLIAQQMFQNQEEVENYRLDALAKYKDSQAVKEEEIEAEWKSLFGALPDKGAKILEESGKDKREYLAEYNVGQHYLEEAQQKLEVLNNQTDLFSSKNKEVLTNIILDQLGKISPEDIKNLQLTEEEKQAFAEIQNQLYGKSLEAADADQIIKDLQEKTYDPAKFYRSQIQGIETIQESIKTLNKELGSLKLGDVIDPDVYSTLSEEIQTYFTAMEDGTYKLIGDAKQFQAAVDRQKASGFENDLNYYNQISQTERIVQDPGVTLTFNSLTEEEAKQRDATAIAYAATADSLQQLNKIKEKFNELNVPELTQTEAINAALQNLATKYETCKDELNDFQTALQSNNSELIAAADEALRYSITTAELAEQMDLAVDDIEDQARAFIEEENSLDKYINTEKEQLKVATKMAALNQSMNKGVTTLSKNWTDWKKILDKSEKTSMDYIDTIQEMRSVLKDLAGITDDNFIPDDFFDVQSNLDLMEEAAKGDVKAINLLGTSLAKAAVEGKSFAEGMQVGFSGLSAGTDAVQMMANSDMMNLLDSAEERFNYYRDNVLSGIDSLTQKISDGVAEAGMDLSQLLSQDAETWAQSLNELAIATGMTVSEMTSMLNSLGIEAEVVSEIKPVHQKVPQYHTITEEAEDSTPERLHTITSTWQDGYYEVDGEMEVAQINMGKNNLGKKPTIRYAGRSTPAPSSITTDAGKGGSSSKAAQKTTQKEYKNVTEESERYHVLTKQLEDLSKSYEKASKQKDRLFGKNRLQAIKDEMSALQALIKHNQAYLSAIGVYLGQDKDKLIKGGLTKDWVDSQGNLQHFTSNAVGIDLRFDENGNVVNYDEYIEHIVAAYNAAVDKYNQDIKQEGLEDDAKEVIEDTFKQAEMQYELALEALKQYEDTNEKFQEKLEEIRDSAREAQDKRLEEWSYQLELRIKVNDEDKRYLEYFRKSLQRFAKDAFAPVTELLSYWNSNGGDSDWKLMKISADTIKSATEDLLNASHGDPVIDPNTGEILQDFEYSQADWMSSLDECEDKIYEQIDAIYELDDTMSHYYADTLSEAETQLDQYMTKMEDCTAVLKHFQAISDLLGKETNYEWIEQILAAERETIQNELESATKEYELAKQQYDTMLARYEADKNSVDEGTRQLMEQELQAQYESMSKWQEKMLSKTEEYAELLNSIYENAIKKIGKAFEDAATKDLGWESLLNSMDRVAAYQDLILTRTNQVYETNKLMNQLSQDIDKTTNTAAKTKLNNFKQEIQDMQNLNVMSKFDLDVAKARYEILKAQIALEDAQNAKSTVRLQRDNEGNYGYVYTADQNDIDNAKQALEDKQNDLYNLTLEKANENAKALAQLDQEMYAELERISLLYKDDEEKMLQERQRIIEEYSQRRSVLVKDYATADYWQQQVSVTQTNEAYGDFYKQNLLDTDEWRAEVSTMVESIDTAYDSWTNDMDTYVRPTVGQNLEELQAKTEDLTAASENFQAWFDDFAATNAQRLDAIAAITHEYFLQRQEVEALITDLQRMAEAINNARAQEAGVERGINNDNTSSISYDPNVDYSALMAEYLKNGGSQEDQQYQIWKAQREAKIAGMNLQEDYYGSRGSQFDENVQIYADNNLTGTIQDAVDALRENTEAVEQSDLSKLSSYDSGGYTGSWGTSGKLALLHEKELVLNAADTENILSAVGLIREFSSAIDMRAAANNIASTLNPGNYETGMQTLQQEVTIHAEFPNATNHNEIEEAFNTLINRASQYANRI